MTDPTTPANLGPSPLEVLLRYCEKARPQPWYPSAFCRETGIPRDAIDPHLDRLRMAGLVQLTDWVQDFGQGYALTPAGEALVANPRAMAQLRQGRLPSAPSNAADNAERGQSTWDRGEAVREAALMRPQGGPVTRVLILLNVAVFVIGMFVGMGMNPPVSPTNYLARGNSEVFLAIGGLFGPDLLEGRWWALLTTCFVHAGILHIGFNMYALSALGPRAEQLWGRWRFLALYLIAGLAGSCAAMIYTPISICVGASGAVYGLLGGELGFLLMNWRHLPPQYVSAWGRMLLTNGILMLVVNAVPGISASAHIGGAVGGALAAFMLTFQRFGTASQRRLGLTGLALTPVGCLLALAFAMNTQPDWVRVQAFVWRDRVAVPIQEAVEAAGKVLEDDAGFKKLLDVRPERRDPEKVQNVLADVRRENDALNRLAAHLSGMTFSAPEVQRSLADCRQYLQAWQDLTQQAVVVLQAGDDWKEQEKKLDALEAALGPATEAWNRAYNRIHPLFRR